MVSNNKDWYRNEWNRNKEYKESMSPRDGYLRR